MSKEKIIYEGGALLPPKKDERNYTISQFVPQKDMTDKKAFCLPLPQNTDITENQYRYSACVGFAFAKALEVITYAKTNKWVDIDPFVIYGTRKSGYQGKGMLMADAAHFVHHEGGFLLRDFGRRLEAPEIIREVEDFKTQNPEICQRAKDFCVEGYAYVDGVEEIKEALLNGMPVVVSYPTTSTQYPCDQFGYVKYPMGGKHVGNHAMCIVGWTEDAHWIVLNSWGTQKGGQGALYISFNQKMNEAIALSDDITPITNKAKRIEFIIGDSVYTADGKTFSFAAKPYIKSGRTYLPVRFVAEALGAAVKWDAETSTATITSEEAVITISDKSDLLTINGIPCKMDVMPEIVNGRMMCPIRYIAEALNCTVGWNQNENKAVITAL